MFNIGTIAIFILGLIISIAIKVKKKKIMPLVIYIISFLLIYLISSAIINDYLIENYLSALENNSLIYLELEKISIDKFEENGEEYFCQAADYLEGRYRVLYYVLDGEEIYQQLGQGLLINHIDDTGNAYKVKVMLKYNKILSKFFMQFHTKSFNVIYVNEENILYLN